jgi:hypothetical protein
MFISSKYVYARPFTEYAIKPVSQIKARNPKRDINCLEKVSFLPGRKLSNTSGHNRFLGNHDTF